MSHERNARRHIQSIHKAHAHHTRHVKRLHAGGWWDRVKAAGKRALSGAKAAGKKALAGAKSVARDFAGEMRDEAQGHLDQLKQEAVGKIQKNVSDAKAWGRSTIKEAKGHGKAAMAAAARAASAKMNEAEISARKHAKAADSRMRSKVGAVAKRGGYRGDKRWSFGKGFAAAMAKYKQSGKRSLFGFSLSGPAKKRAAGGMSSASHRTSMRKLKRKKAGGVLAKA